MKIPELDKLSKVRDKSQVVGEFIDWLSSQEMCICKMSNDDDHYYPTDDSIEELLGKFFDIDMDKCETERRMLLNDCRDELEVKTDNGEKLLIGTIRDESRD